MKSLRTPDERFHNLPDYNFEPHYVTIDDTEGGSLRVHYIDEGPRDADPILLMHGEPSWSFLYRKMIGPLVAAGHRVVAPDLIGFGRSDKPTERADYTYARHVTWMKDAIFNQLNLRNITFFGQDWGGLVGLRLVTAEPDRFARVVIGNTGLPVGDGKLSDAFLAWQKFSQESPVFPIGKIVSGGCVREMSKEVIAAYDAPFPDETFKEGARQFPSLVPSRLDDPERDAQLAAWDVLRTFDKPFLCSFSDKDAVTIGGSSPFLREVPGTKDQPHTTIENAGHFLQEDAGEEVAEVIARFIASTPR